MKSLLPALRGVRLSLRQAGLLLTVHAALYVQAQQGRILMQRSILYDDKPIAEVLMDKAGNKEKLKPAYAYLDSVRLFEVTYLSDGLKVKGVLITPAADGNYPCIIFNRGGQREIGNIRMMDAVSLAHIASKGYVVAASYYRGNGGSEGQEEFGGTDVNDVLNMIPMLAGVKGADTTRIGMYGWSRGGMMTYIALTRTNRIKTAVVGGAPADLHALIKTRPGMEKLFTDLIPDYTLSKTIELTKRSAKKWSCEMSADAPLLILHGSADASVPVTQSIDLDKQLDKCKGVHELKIFEGGDHDLTKHQEEKDKIVLDWFQRYLKSEMPLATDDKKTKRKPSVN